MDEVLLPNKGKGKEIFDYLKKELGIPDRPISVEVRFAVGEIVKVTVEYMPTAPVEQA